MTPWETIFVLVAVCVVCQQIAGMTYVQSIGCVYNGNDEFRLQCNSSLEVIHIQTATVGRSTQKCRNESTCCPGSEDSIITGTPCIVQQLNSACDGYANCSVIIPKVNISSERCDYYSVNYTCGEKSMLSSSTDSYTNNTLVEINCQPNQNIYIVRAILGKDNTMNGNSQPPCYKQCQVFTSTRHMHYLKNTCNGKQGCQIKLVTQGCFCCGAQQESVKETIQYFCMNVSQVSTSAAELITPTGSSTTTTASTSTRGTLTTNAANAVVVTPTTVKTVKPSRKSDNGDIGGGLTIRVVIIAGITLAACVLVGAVFIIIIVRKRRGRPPEAEQPYRHIVTNNTTKQPSSGAHVYYNIGQTMASPVVSQVVRGKDDRQTSPDVSIEALYSKPNKHKKRVDYDNVYGRGRAGVDGLNGDCLPGMAHKGLDYVDIDHNVTLSERSIEVSSLSPGVIYTEVQRKRKGVDTALQEDNGGTPGGDGMVMVDNDLYGAM